MKYIFVSGGVVSGLGKGITAASVGLLLESLGIKVTSVKIDMYLNIDAGTIRPQEHGEVFVTADGLETDQDLGNYERFLNTSLHRVNYMTTGQVYRSVIDRERAFGYNGEDVEAIPHITDEIISRLEKAGTDNQAEVVIVELGGTVGEYQNILFFEANRILKLRQPGDVVHIHVSYLPLIRSIGELKSKPAQQSTQSLNGLGIQPDFLVARSEKPIDEKRIEKLALFCNLQKDDIISNPDLDSIYKVPLFLEDQSIAELILHKLSIRPHTKTPILRRWRQFVEGLSTATTIVNVALVGKYFNTGDYKLSDSYISVIEAIRHASSFLNIKVDLTWVNSEDVENNQSDLKNFDGIIVPQGWGSRGVEGKIKAVQVSRKAKIPFLGLCFGMQMAVVEFSRHVVKMKKANSAEVDPATPKPVIHVMPDQAEFLSKNQYGGTIRLGSYPCKLKKGTVLHHAYKTFGNSPQSPWHQDGRVVAKEIDNDTVIYERHRHRYEVNNQYLKALETAGLVISGTSPDGQLVEAIELKDHPFFVGTQFHPEYISRPLSPHPIFIAFLKACLEKSTVK